MLFLYRCVLFCCQIQLLGKVRRWTERVLAGQRETLSTREYCIRFEMSLLQECPVQDLSTTFEIKHRSYQTTPCSEKVDIDLLTKAALLQIIFWHFPKKFWEVFTILLCHFIKTCHSRHIFTLFVIGLSRSHESVHQRLRHPHCVVKTPSQSCLSDSKDLMLHYNCIHPSAEFFIKSLKVSNINCP